MDENKNFRCIEAGCGKAFWYKAALKRHMNTHKEIDPDEPTFSWACNECPKVFAKIETLRRHVKTTHGVVQVYPCTVEGCGQLFQRKDNLARHSASHGDNKHCCEICGKSFARKDALTRHKYIHAKQIKAAGIEENTTANSASVQMHRRPVGAQV